MFETQICLFALPHCNSLKYYPFALNFFKVIDVYRTLFQKPCSNSISDEVSSMFNVFTGTVKNILSNYGQLEKIVSNDLYKYYTLPSNIKLICILEVHFCKVCDANNSYYSFKILTKIIPLHIVLGGIVYGPFSLHQTTLYYLMYNKIDVYL